jgi:hypothetical protein
MAADDATRRRLFELLARDTSSETASLLMENLPPQGWPELATKTDIARLDGRMDGLRERIAALAEATAARFDGIDARFDGIDARFAGLDEHVEGLAHKIDASSDRVLNLVGAELRNHSRSFIYGSICVVLATAAVVLASIRLG